MFARTELAIVRLRLATAYLKHVTGGGLLVAVNYRLGATSGRGLLTRVDGACVDVDASGRWAWGIPGSRDADLSASSCNLDTSESIGCKPTEGVGMSDSTPDREPNRQRWRPLVDAPRAVKPLDSLAAHADRGLHRLKA